MKRCAAVLRPAHFVKGLLREVAQPVASILKRPDPSSPQISQALWGEAGMVFEEKSGFAWVQMQNDGYVGYVASDALRAPAGTPTHRVTATSTLLYPEADIKSQPAQFLPMNAALAVVESTEKFLHLASGEYVFAAHAAPLSRQAADFVSVAETFLHVPYYWGGKTAQGLDCSGLVQVSLAAAGVAAPRDSDMQQHNLGQIVQDDVRQRGDLVFWPGHVGIMQSASQLLHATGFFMKVVSEPLADVVARSDKLISCVRRLSGFSHNPAAKSP